MPPDTEHDGGTADGGGGARRATPHAHGAVPLLPDVEAELRARLRSACREWPEAEFDALVRRIARVKVRWAEGDYLD